MGFDTLKPFTAYSSPDKGGKGAFVLLCTSNPGMTDIEHQELAEGGLLLERVGAELQRIGEEWRYSCADYNDQTCGIFGAVVGAFCSGGTICFFLDTALGRIMVSLSWPKAFCAVAKELSPKQRSLVVKLSRLVSIIKYISTPKLAKFSCI